jgi:hypothetical protein
LPIADHKRNFPENFSIPTAHRKLAKAFFPSFVHYYIPALRQYFLIPNKNKVAMFGVPTLNSYWKEACSHLVYSSPSAFYLLHIVRHQLSFFVARRIRLQDPENAGL